MKYLLRVFGTINPFFYGGAYLACIPFFGFLLHYIDCFQLKNNENIISDLISSIYFSAVTITTLGYGDITPFNTPTRLLVIFEASFGVVLAGLFLNSLAHKQSKIIQEYDKETFEKIELNKRLNKLLSYNKMINLNLCEYENYIIIMTSPYGCPARPYGNIEPDFKFNPNFIFADIKDLYKSTGRLQDHSYTPAVEYFYKSLNNLTISLEQALSLDLFIDFKELEDEIRDFILLSRRWDMQDVLLAQVHTRMGEEPAVLFYERMIENLTSDEMELRKGYIMNPFIVLFHLLKQSSAFVKYYNESLEKIKKMV